MFHQMELRKNDSKMIQGLAVLSMVWLHLFDRPENGCFYPLIYFLDVPLSFYIAQLCDFCVFAFAFCTGYAHVRTITEQNYYIKRLKGLLSLLLNYWMILILFSEVSILIGNASAIPGSIKKFLMHAFLLENSYNGAWWYLYAYTVLVVSSPILCKFVLKMNSWMVFGSGLLVYLGSYILRFYFSFSGLWLPKLGPLGMTIFEYIIGAIFAKEVLFTRLHNRWNCFSRFIKFTVAIGSVVFFLFIRTLFLPNMIYAPFSGIVIIVLFHFWEKKDRVEHFFLFFGEHSTNIWLTHMFFYLTLFRDLVYCARFPIFIFILMIGITSAISIVLKYLQQKLVRCVKIR